MNTSFGETSESVRAAPHVARLATIATLEPRPERAPALAIAVGFALLLGASVGQHAVVHRGLAASTTIALHLTATLGYLLLCRLVLREAWRPRGAVAFAVALGLALTAVTLTPQLSDDLYRYVFEGRVVGAGLSPYRCAPSAPEVAHLRDALWSSINNQDISAAYPPAVQYANALAVAVAPTLRSVQVTYALCALLAFAALWRFLPAIGLAPARAVVFGWCPLLWQECAAEGHSESLAVLFTVLALWAATRDRPLLAGLALAVATAGKLLPIVLLPFLARRSARVWLGCGAGLLALYAPFLGDPTALWQGTAQYAARWRGNDSAYGVIEAVTRALASPWWHGAGYSGWLAGWDLQRLAKLPLAALAAFVLWRHYRGAASPERAGLAFFTFFVACAPTLHPWYVVLWLLWLPIFPRAGYLLFTGTVALAYHVLPGWLAAQEWREIGWVKGIEYVPFYAALLLGCVDRDARG